MRNNFFIITIQFCIIFFLEFWPEKVLSKDRSHDDTHCVEPIVGNCSSVCYKILFHLIWKQH